MRYIEKETCNILVKQRDSKKNKNLRFSLVRYNRIMYRLICYDETGRPVWHRVYRGVNKALKAFKGFSENWEGF